jgi:hypothetical protein
MVKVTVSCAMLALALSVMPEVAAAAETPVARVVVVETTDLATYVRLAEKSKELFKKAGSPGQIRVWRARFAGREAGTVVVTIEYPGLEALAKDEGNLATNPEWLAMLAELAKIRKIVSDSVYVELKP